MGIILMGDVYSLDKTIEVLNELKKQISVQYLDSYDAQDTESAKLVGVFISAIDEVIKTL